MIILNSIRGTEDFRVCPTHTMVARTPTKI
jgi:hypothetical protein